MLQLASEMRIGRPMRDRARQARAMEDATFAALSSSVRPN